MLFIVRNNDNVRRRFKINSFIDLLSSYPYNITFDHMIDTDDRSLLNRFENANTIRVVV